MVYYEPVLTELNKDQLKRRNDFVKEYNTNEILKKTVDNIQKQVNGRKLFEVEG